MEKRVTQRDIAKRVGVDVSTVSLALNGHPRLSEATRLKVLEAAEALGYRPDPALSSIASTRWRGRRSQSGMMLALLIDSRDRNEAELMEYTAGIQKQAGLLGYGVTTVAHDDFGSPASFWRVMRTRGIRGVVVGQSRYPLDEDLFHEDVAPVVQCGFLRESPGERVCPDLRLAVREAARQVLRYHASAVCFLPVDPELASDHILLGAAYMAARIETDQRLTLLEASEPPAPSDLARLRDARPSAVITINERQARLVRSQEWGGHPPAIYTLHTLPPFEGKRGMDLRLETCGRAAVNLLEMKMRRLPLSSASFRQTLLIEPRWLEASDRPRT